ncbi:MAG: Rieske 2Fe-2S domain-containing protein [Candidatus Latescibacteria bacterium]|nr:Rieske 2Fe-2S domain-containing protein [Candidatus Latescibacterota bacterium]NIM21408.1 Rieske 2Fe-2S domain-containing protein [Candidatus Latescibacterota bacterium]NIM65589.1 Rieske 2Fe-2S domain-containing protein [Candidatus Latescibacterota bacterium]NIO01969.1 Rieske 2Fe-2S domain-containing protein [Candidatus Latescibacterota bacterium]NIO28782.1 Rieske 2Fe-2S domain-containing protein [Candidatus Latescibacterota bacterium]
MKRRSFINVLLSGGIAVWLGSVIASIIAYLLPPEAAVSDASSVKAATTDELEPDSAKIFQFGKKPGLLLRLEDGGYRAFVAVCTHLSCTVQYRKDMGVIWCACHNGKFNKKGINIAGPPPKPLDELEVHIRGEDIFVSKPVT